MFTSFHLTCLSNSIPAALSDPSHHPPTHSMRGLGLAVEMLQQQRARKEKRDFFFFFHSLCCFHARTPRVGLAGLSTGCLCVLGAGKGNKEQSLNLSGVFLWLKACRYCQGRCFWGARHCTRTLTPYVCLGGTSQSSRGQRSGERETRTFLGLHSTGADTQQEDNWPRLQALPTSFLKINTCGPGGHRGVCGCWKRPGIYAAGLCRVVADPGASAPEHTHRAPGGLCRQTLTDLPSAHSRPTWQRAGLLGRLQPLADRSKRSSRGKCHGGKFRK